MSTDDFRRLIIRLVESCSLDPEAAACLLRRILEILTNDDRKEEER